MAYWPLLEVASTSVDLLFGNFEVVGVVLREDLTVNSYAVKLEDPSYNGEWEEAVKSGILTYDYKDML
jgi:hypothetical protein